jgi:hypothetical protein
MTRPVAPAAVFVLLLCFLGVGASTHQKPTDQKFYGLGSPSPLYRTLHSLIAHSARVLIAEVVSIEPVAVDSALGAHQRQHLERVRLRACVKCNISKDHPAGVRDLKNNKNLTDATGTIDITLAPGSTARLDPDVRVLWFLSAEDSNRVTQTVGSGLFIISDDDPVFQFVVDNGYENTGLWSPKEPLWKFISKETVRLNLRTHYTKLYPSDATEATEARVNKVLDEGSKREPRGPLPLDLLTAIVVTAR